MASALASQLNELARRQQPALPSTLKKGKASLLFDFQKAADVDLQTIFDIACQGLEELCRLEPRFRPFRESLFSRASLDINPDLQTQEFLTKLEESVLNFSCLLSNYFLSPGAFKTLEYLIRRYKSNERHVDALMTAALPYHATNEFVRLVQTLALGAPGSRWGWLSKMQTSGAALPRDLLAQRCANDRGLLLFICKAAGRFGGAPAAPSAAAPSAAAPFQPYSRTYLSFYAVLLCEVLAALPAVTEDVLAALLPHLLEGLGKAAAQDYRAATLMAVAELCSRATLGREFVKVLLNTMLKYTEPVPDHIRTALLVMAHVALTQPHIRTLSDKTLKYLSALPNALSELASLAQRGSMRLGPLLVLLVRSLAAALVSASSSSSRSRYASDLTALAHAGALRGEPASALASSLLAAGSAAQAGSDVQAAGQKLLRLLDQRYPESTDAAVNAFLEPLRRTPPKPVAAAAAAGTSTADAAGPRKRRKTSHKAAAGAGSGDEDEGDEDEADDSTAAVTADAAAAGLSAEERARFDFVRATFAAGYAVPCGGTMLTLAAALNAPQAAVRRMALLQLDAAAAAAAAATPPADADADAEAEAGVALSTAALARLRDDDLGVVAAALGLACLRRLPPAALLDALQPLLQRLGEYLHGSARLPQLKAAKKAARKAVALVGHAGATSSAAAQTAAMLLAPLLLPSHRDPRVALEAARAAAGLPLPLLAALGEAMPALEAALQPPQAAAAAADDEGEAGDKKGGKKGSKAKGKSKGKAAAAEEEAPAGADAAGSERSKKAAQRAAAASLERAVVTALAKALAADPSARLPELQALAAACAAAGAANDGATAGAAALRAQHLVALVAHAAVAASSHHHHHHRAHGAAARSPAKASSQHPHSQHEQQLARGVVALAEALLPYARLAAAGDADWRAAFASHVSSEDGLPTPAHAAALQADPVAAHGAVVLGTLHAALTALPEASEHAGDADAADARRGLALLASLGCSPEQLGYLPLLVVTRGVKPRTRSAFLAAQYAAPAEAQGEGAGQTAAVRCLALRTQAQLAMTTAAAATAAAPGGARSSSSSRHGAAGASDVDVSGWLVCVLTAAASPEASVRAAACDCLATVQQLLSEGSAGAGAHFSAAAAAELCASLLAHRALLCRDADAAAALLRAALQPPAGDAAATAAAPAPTPSKSRRGAAAAKQPAAGAAAAAADGGPARPRLELQAASEAAAYLTACLRALDADPHGINAASFVLACLLPDSAAAAEAAAPAAAVQDAGSSLLGRLLARLRDHPASATALDARAAQQLLRLLAHVPAGAAAAAAYHEGLLAQLAEAAELLPPPSLAAVAAVPPGAVAALAHVRLAAASAITPGVFAALPPGGRTVRVLFAVLLARYEGDPDEAVRTAARTALETVPLSAELLLPLLDPPSATATAAATTPAPAVTPARKKAKKGGDAAAAAPETGVSPAAAAVAAAAVTPLPPGGGAVTPAALRDAVMALELLQWRTGIAEAHKLVPACQALLRRLLPMMGSLAETATEEGGAAAAANVGAEGDDAAEGGARSSLAGYAATLALTALRGLAAPHAAEARQLEGAAFEVELAVRAAREAPDAVVRNAALGLLAALAARAPEAALSHVLQVLAVVNQAAALHDHEHSRAVGATALAAVVPAWMSGGQRPSGPLWEQVASVLPSLPPHRRLDLLLALMRALPQPEEGLSEGLLVLLQHAAAPPPPTPAAAQAPTTPAGGKSAKKARTQAATPAPAAATVDAAAAATAGPPPSEWLPELASQLALQVELPVRLACLARLLAGALAASRQLPHTALPRIAVAFISAQLKLKAAVSAASAAHRRSDADPALAAGCKRLMEAALSAMQLLQPDAVAAGEGSGAAAGPPSGRAAAVLAASRGLYDLFGALQGVMEASAYLQALLTLAEHPSDKVKRRAIKLFTDKVRGVKSEIGDRIELPQRVRDAQLRQAAEAAGRACAMLPPLLAAAAPEGGEGEGASPLTRQLALVALAAIAAEFGAQQHAALLAGAPAVLAATRDSHASIRASALAAVAAFVRALGQRLVPVLPATVAATVAAADAAWARLSRSGGGDGGAGAGGVGKEGAASEGGDSDVDADEDDEDGGGARLRRRGGEGEEDAALELSAALAALNALVETLGGFLSPHLPAVLSILLNPRVLACRAAGCDTFAASIRGRLPGAVPPRLLLPALFDRLQPAIDAAADPPTPDAAAAPAVALLGMVADAAAGMDPKLAAQHAEALFAFLLRALDVRQRQPPPLAAHGEAAVAAVEGGAVRALVALVMKLSEARFKPLFLRLLEWGSTVSLPEVADAGGEPSYLGRMAALFAAVNALTDRLRSVMVPYFRYLLDVIVQHLGDGGDGGGKASRSKKKQRRGAVATDADGAAGGVPYSELHARLSWLLRLRMVRALHRCFMHDSVGFVEAERFARLQPVLLAQLDAEPPPTVVAFLLTPHHLDPDLDAYVTLGAATRPFTAPDGPHAAGPLGAAAVGCALALAVAANSDALWKPLNHGALMLTRSASPRTRALALEVVAQLVDRLREEYLVLLPESLPFFAELLEDLEQGVGTRVREVVRQLEEISGEKLDEYLKV